MPRRVRGTVTTVRVLSLVTNGRSRFYRQQIAGLRERGHTVDALAVPRAGTESDSRSVGAYARYYPRAFAAARRGYDVVHANYGLTAPPAVAQPFAPVVVSLWGSDLMGRYGAVSRLAARFADEVIVMSGEMAGLLASDCHVIPHGIDLETFRPLPRSVACAEVGWRSDRRHVLFPYPPDRGVKDFPRARRIVDAAADELDRAVELHTVTGVPHARMPWHFNAADALLVTSRREGSPNSVKEALACDCPVISTDVGDVAERLDGVSHSAVAADDAELAARLADALAAETRSDGRASVASLGIERQLDRVETVYRSALDTEVPRSR
ncbi:glycosyltransferase family 4 protein [Halorubrum sp. AD140]|uniref:glycosyltransferase family 4 protein n=1 Tax=Halorubrum sp. AD140 TaxID=3050073 RepID=UPI002ACC436A|nr:glycosyltransferase family 4 protein [Halorubrum sp. AD140]MDZ5810226.1 glycosyltransferase family 4 protein [Halorubrum sp. AD140]